MNNDFLVLKNVTKSFGKVTVIDNLSIPQGKMVTLLGPSGCGKTNGATFGGWAGKPNFGADFY